MFGALAACLAVLIVTSTARRAIYVREAEVQDQNSASTAYAYNSNSGPVSYAYFSKGFGGENVNFPQYYEPYYQLYEHLGYNVPKRYGYGGLDGYVLHNGEDYGGSHFLQRGHAGQKENNAQESYNKGSQGKHDNENHKGYYNNERGDKSGHHESAEKFSNQNEGGKSSNGGSYSVSGGHRKGSKTTGYHKVYKKNEYKKDNTFYDESDKRGHFNKYANADSYRKGESGALEKGGHYDAGFHESKQGENGDHDKGHYDVVDSKFSDQQGKEGYRENYSGYAKDRKENENLYGYKEA
ncbi:uncharacterized protein DDB_G0290685-like [Photinus pyralis]|uniref:uncharacterized protein DDB_G0290685-like n=1 Tax=Photinus pyralis TaxID=7054 RepID=UPI00126742CA|nr:uncharacterized protein DDB_G0290685-like [Photinus pyralis]